MYRLKDVEGVSDPFPISAQCENVNLDNVELVSENGKEYILFHYSMGDRKLVDRRFPVNKESLSQFQRTDRDTGRPTETLQETEVRMTGELVKVLRHVASRFCSKDELDSLDGGDFTTFCSEYCTLVNSKCKGINLYMKTVINNRGYVSAPKAGRFLQRMDEGGCNLSYNDKEKDLIKKNSNREGVSVVENVEETE